MVVVGVGFTGGLVFMYVQDRFYHSSDLTKMTSNQRLNFDKQIRKICWKCRVYVDLIKRFKNENKGKFKFRA